MNEIVLAGDLGGTNLRVAAVDSDGTLLNRCEAVTRPRRERVQEYVDAIAALAAKSRSSAGGPAIRGFGLAIPAVIKSSENRIFSSPNLPELTTASDLADELAARLNIDVTLENDATAAAVGEHWLGVRGGFAHSICVTLGTGVGGGIILNGEPVRGPDGTAGEIGHICVEPLGVPCGCGSIGCVEQYSSATAISTNGE